MGVGLGNSLLQAEEDGKRLQVPQKNISSNKAASIASPGERGGPGKHHHPWVPSHEPRHEAVERLRNNSCWQREGSVGSVWLSVGTCHRECNSKTVSAWARAWVCTGVSHCRERGGSVGGGGARRRGSICGGVAIGDGVDVWAGCACGLITL